jgi:hypothetical protein
MPGYRFAAWLRPLLNLAALAGVLSLAACGGGNGAPNNPFQGGAGPLAISPSVANLYSGNPFVFAVTGGNGPYAITSSDQAVLPVVGVLDGNTLVVTPGNVGADTPVTLTVRDAQNQSTTAAITVKPALLLPNAITVTGNTNCTGATLCSGQNGTATVLVTGPAGAPLAGRNIRFDVVQGEFSIVSPAPGEPLVPSLTTVSDQNGFATAKLSVPSSALTQIATIRATDLASGNTIATNFTIIAFKDGSQQLSVSPTSVSVPGSPHDPPQCAIGIPVTYYVYGGTPPYTVAASLPTFVSITGVPVASSGGGFTVRASACVDETLTITDASGRFVNASFASVLGPAATPGGGTGGTDCSFSPLPAGCPAVSPTALALTACTGTGSSATASVTSTTTPVAAAPAGLTATITGSASPFTLTVTRASGTVPSPATVTVSAGSLSQNVSVTVTPTTCP